MEYDNNQCTIWTASQCHRNAQRSDHAALEVLNMRSIFSILLTLSLTLVAGAQQQPQPQQAQQPQQPFTLQINTQLVVETVVVKDKDGKDITGLTDKDFVITEDNVPQTISVFEFQKLDDSTPPPTPV